jgi:uncharacterized protein YybS (DUF2232 family)
MKMNSINIRSGFRRLSIGFIVFAWFMWLLIVIFDSQPNAAQLGAQLFYGLVMTVGYMLVCKGIAWVFNGFFPPQS